MKISLRGLALAALSCATVLAAGSAAAEQKHTAIPFADIGNIRDWQADSPNTLYVQAMNRKWYQITFWSPCTSLPFAIRIAFVTDALGSLDKYSSILVDGERCWFHTFEPSSAPPSASAKR